ncbi:hypothetical protein HAX54_033427 [Datura stramonium]|uniref:Uncharacterized protein n=1 Tax=Datura stramonium TaxID=4076 RepID=A0ABS8VF27_DATST|nr:hypothetical protein [Datura stramonium]
MCADVHSVGGIAPSHAAAGRRIAHLSVGHALVTHGLVAPDFHCEMEQQEVRAPEQIGAVCISPSSQERPGPVQSRFD